MKVDICICRHLFCRHFASRHFTVDFLTVDVLTVDDLTVDIWTPHHWMCTNTRPINIVEDIGLKKLIDECIQIGMFVILKQSQRFFFFLQVLFVVRYPLPQFYVVERPFQKKSNEVLVVVEMK